MSGREKQASPVGTRLGAISQPVLSLLIVMVVLIVTAPTVADDFAKAKQVFDAEKYHEAVRLLRPLARNGDPRAQHLLGYAYFHGSRVGYDFGKAQFWLERAVSRDYTPAFAPLGQLLLKTNNGRSERGLRLIRTAVARGDAYAQSALGWLYLYGQGGVPRNFQESERLFLRAAEQKYGQAFFDLALWHAHDQGKKPDYVEMWKWVIVDRRIGTEGAVYFFREKAMKHLSKEQIAEAKRRATAWLKAHGEVP